MLNTITNVFTSTTSEISSLLSDITAATGTVSVSSMLFALILGVVMGFLISLVYVLTHRKSGYTQSYVLTLLMLPPIVAIILWQVRSAWQVYSRSAAIEPYPVTRKISPMFSLRWQPV